VYAFDLTHPQGELMTAGILQRRALALLPWVLATTGLTAAEPVDTSGIMVKKAIADSMTPEQLQAYKERLARNFATHQAPTATSPDPDAPGDTCSAATFELIWTFPYGPVADTTAGAVDNYDLPTDTSNPTCAAPVTCTGAGPAGSLPRGAIYTGTGTAPDRAWRIQCLSSGTVTITAQPTAPWDLALILYQPNCSSLLADCACVSDVGVAGQGESIQFNMQAGSTYFIVIDGYASGGTPPGPTGPYTVTLGATPGLFCTPVELQGLTIE